MKRTKAAAVRDIAEAISRRNVERVDADSAKRLLDAVDAKQKAEETAQQAQITLAQMTLNHQMIERAIAKRYKLNAGDGVAADGTIIRKAVQP